MLELDEGKLSRPVLRRGDGSNPGSLAGAGRKGRQDLARSLPGFKVLGVLFLGEVSPAFLPSLKACGSHEFRHLGVGQQYPGGLRAPVADWRLSVPVIPSSA